MNRDRGMRGMNLWLLVGMILHGCCLAMLIERGCKHGWN